MAERGILIYQMLGNPLQVFLSSTLHRIKKIRVSSLTWDSTTFTPPSPLLYVECNNVISEGRFNQELANPIATFPLFPVTNTTPTTEWYHVIGDTVNVLNFRVSSNGVPCVIDPTHNFTIVLDVEYHCQ